jgi:hypothetical protein
LWAVWNYGNRLYANDDSFFVERVLVSGDN